MSVFPRFLEYFALSGLGVCAALLTGIYLWRLSGRARIYARRYGIIGLLAAAFFGFAAITEGPPDEDYKAAVQEELDGEGETNAVYGAMLCYSPRRALSAPSPAPTTEMDLSPRLVYVVTNEVDYTMPTNAVEYAPWRLRGAAEDWFKLGLEGGSDWWRFPKGTNEYSAFRVFTDGTIRPKLHSLNDTISAVGTAMSAIPDVSRFWYSVGTNDSRILTWENFVVGRITSLSVSAQIELFPSGDYIVRSNNVERLYRFIDPFEVPEEAWGQSDADKAYIDAMVGTNLENGYYKLTVTVPPSVGRRTLITVGDQQLVADQSGEYAFLLAKGEEYELSLLPFSPDITFAAVDDIRPPMMMMGAFGYWQDWTMDGGSLTLRGPTFLRPGCCLWMPTFKATPPIGHIYPGGESSSFTAILSDYPYWRPVSYVWGTDDWNVIFGSPYSRETTIEINEMPSWSISEVWVDAFFGTNVLRSTASFTYGTNSAPTPAGVSVSFSNSFILFEGEREVASGEFVSPTSTVVTLTCSASGGIKGGHVDFSFEGADKVLLSSDVQLPYSRDLMPGEDISFDIVITGESASDTIEDVVATGVLLTEDGRFCQEAKLTSVKVETYAHCSWIPYHERRRFGVNEMANISLIPVEAENIAMITGCDKRGDSFVYKAAGHMTNEVVSIDLPTSVHYELVLSVVEPEYLEAVECYANSSVEVGKAGGINGLFTIAIFPTNVSFTGIQEMEVPRVSTNAVGYFAQPELAGLLDHGSKGAGSWHGVNSRNLFFDFVSISEIPPPWGDGGSFSWPVPNAWRVIGDNVSTNLFSHRNSYDQRFELQPDGTASITKFNHVLLRSTNTVQVVVGDCE